eukprot:5459986-Pleurochrysis_carterae.AAC.2
MSGLNQNEQGAENTSIDLTSQGLTSSKRPRLAALAAAQRAAASAPASSDACQIHTPLPVLTDA